MASSLQPVALHSTAQAITKGERHCGTNFIDAVLRHNFGDGAVHAWTDHSNTVYSGCDIKEQPRLALTDGGHAGPDSRYYCCAKHGVPSTACVWPHAAPVAGVVFLMRSPYAWIPEMRASPYGAVRVKQYPNFSWFLHSPFPDYVNIKFGDASPGHHIMHATPMAMWSSKVGACRRYASQAAVAGGPAGVFVSYTDLFNASALAAKLVPALAAWGFPSRRHANATYNKASDDGGTASAPQQGADEDEDEGVVAADGFELPLDAEAKATDNNKMTEEARRARADATTTLHGSSPCAPLHSPCHARALSATPSPHPSALPPRAAVHSRGVEGAARAREQAQHVDAALLRLPVGGWRRLPARRTGRPRLLQRRHPRRGPAALWDATRAHARAVGVQRGGGGDGGVGARRRRAVRASRACL